MVLQAGVAGRFLLRPFEGLVNNHPAGVPAYPKVAAKDKRSVQWAGRLLNF